MLYYFTSVPLLKPTYPLIFQQKNMSVHSSLDSSSYRLVFSSPAHDLFYLRYLVCVIFAGEASWCYLGKIFRILQQKKYYYVWWYWPKLPNESTKRTQGNFTWNFRLLLLFLILQVVLSHTSSLYHKERLFLPSKHAYFYYIFLFRLPFVLTNIPLISFVSLLSELLRDYQNQWNCDFCLIYTCEP